MVRTGSARWLLWLALAAPACSSHAPTPASCESEAPTTNGLDGVDGGTESVSCDGGCTGIMNNLALLNFTGTAATFSPVVPDAGTIPTSSSALGTSYGTNGRTCFTCHAFDDGWTLSTDVVQQAFQSNAQVASNTDLDPIFRTNDGTNSPNDDVSTPAARQAAYSMIVNRATIRVGIAMPMNAEFTLTAVDDPYGFASATELSLFRRPLPTQNLSFESDLMWDGRETVACGSISDAAANQANDAIVGHAQAAQPLTLPIRTAIVDFEKTLFAAQLSDFDAGPLDGDGALGGPVHLAAQPFHIGINDSAGHDPTGGAFQPNVFTLFDAWASLPSTSQYAMGRAAVVRGQALFNSRSFAVSGVRGLNDELGQATIQATCSTCHDTPNVGNSSLSHRYDIGVSDASQRTPDLPLYTFTNTKTGEVLQSTDPGRALVSGLWKDLGRFKVPALRNMAARFPFLHNGGAPRIKDAVAYHDTRFSIGLSASEQSDLVAFLQAL